MHRILTKGLLMSLLLTTVFLASLAQAEPPHIENPATAEGGVVTAKLTEAWRAGGEDDDIFFGSVATIRTDPDGTVYVLDGQVSEVHVYAPDGEHLRTVFREGDGPGEIRRPNDMYLGQDGTVCALQDFPGRVIKVDAEGLPAGEIRYSRGQSDQQQMAVLNRGFDLDEGLVLVGIRMVFGGAVSEQTYFVAICDEEGTETVALVEKENPVDYANFVMTEAGMDFAWNRLAVGRDGTISVGPGRDTYEIQVFDSQGTLLRTIARDYTPGKRDDEEIKIQRQILEAIGAYYPRPPISFETENTSPAIAGMWATEDGRLWVQTGDAHKNTPEGTWMVLDVFSPEGTLEKQVALPGSYEGREDALYVQPDGRIFVVVGSLDAFLNQQAVNQDEESTEEQAPLEVICYDTEL